MKARKIFLSGLSLLAFSGLIQSQPAESGSGLKNEGNCIASWGVTLDTLSLIPYLYEFKDNSTGNINSWTWDFGDGSSSSMQNPVHQYDNAGSYNICLTVADINSPDSCYDQVCKEITTVEYFSLGGLVFSGEYPLNNPVPEGDTGIAYIYRVIGEQVIYLEEHTFYEYGYYGFGFLLPGSYLVKIGLTPASQHYNHYFTTYMGNGVKWQTGSHITISDSNYYSAEIHLAPVQMTIAGTGVIRGTIKFEQGSESQMPANSEITVILSDNSQTPIRFAIPNSSGYFEFKELPFNNYFITADATGKPSTTMTVSLSADSPVVDNISLTIFGSNVQNIPEEYPSGLYSANIFPNPVDEDLFLRINSTVSTYLDIHIINMAGKEFQGQTVKVIPGQNNFHFPVGNLPKGLYIIRLKPEAYYTPISGKFVK